jgi:molecular chaperone Hsp33
MYKIPMFDRLVSFTFEDYPIRGSYVCLQDSWRKVLQTSLQNLNETLVQDTLSEFVVSGLLLGSTIKMQGSLLIQMLGEGPLSMLLVEVFVKTAQDSLDFRAMARTDAARLDSITDISLSNLIPGGTLSLTIDPSEGSQAYQSIVPLSSNSITRVFESYMEQSEQIDTRLFLSSSHGVISGMLLQLMPSEEGNSPESGREFLEKISNELDSCLDAISYQGSAPEYLHALFPEYDIRVYDARDVSFVCTCSRDKIVSLLVTLGKEEAENVVREEGSIKVSCEFCGKSYEFDSIDTAELFTSQGVTAVPGKWKN